MRAEYPSAPCSWTMAGGSKTHETPPQDKGDAVCGVAQMNPVLTCAQTRLVLRQGALPVPGWGWTLSLSASAPELLSVLFAAAKSHSLQRGVREPEQMGTHRVGVPGGVRHLMPWLGMVGAEQSQPKVLQKAKPRRLLSFPHAVPCQEGLSFWEEHRKVEFQFVVHIPQTPKTTCWMGSLTRLPPSVHSPASQWERRRQQCGAGTGDQALPFLCIWAQPNATNREKPGICTPAVPSPSGPQCQGHRAHPRSGIKRLLAATPGVHLSHTISPQEK